MEGWLCRGGCRGGGGGVVAMVAVLGGGERDVVEVGAVGSGAVVSVYPLGGGGLEVVAVLPGAVAPERAPRLCQRAFLLRDGQMLGRRFLIFSRFLAPSFSSLAFVSRFFPSSNHKLPANF